MLHDEQAAPEQLGMIFVFGPGNGRLNQRIRPTENRGDRFMGRAAQEPSP
jgi:hypothetical protein